MKDSEKQKSLESMKVRLGIYYDKSAIRIQTYKTHPDFLSTLSLMWLKDYGDQSANLKYSTLGMSGEEYWLDCKKNTCIIMCVEPKKKVEHAKILPNCKQEC